MNHLLHYPSSTESLAESPTLKARSQGSFPLALKFSHHGRKAFRAERLSPELLKLMTIEVDAKDPSCKLQLVQIQIPGAIQVAAHGDEVRILQPFT